jgi:hypothetical protein
VHKLWLELAKITIIIATTTTTITTINGNQPFELAELGAGTGGFLLLGSPRTY